MESLSARFHEDLESFTADYFVKDTKKPFYVLQEKIKELQALAKSLTLTSDTFMQTRATLGALWDEIKRKQKVHSFLRKKMHELGSTEAHIEVSLGDPATRIVEFAEEIEAEMIVMPSQDRKSLSRFLIGSVAERVIRLAHCPVLVLKS